MTRQEFDETRWAPGMTCVYGDFTRKVLAVEFLDRLVELSNDGNDPVWVSYEDIDNLTKINGWKYES